ncbi:acetoin utilization protein AcuC [Nocardioides sp. Bht2]|uniref:acetoin utilization protein AcuC n=1 Tax=Nocardioides sp. Bht2 TaxID=3392297 RepID=UPI0039B5ACDA
MTGPLDASRCGRRTAIFDPRWLAYDFGEHHPMAPLRVELTMSLAQRLGVMSAGGLEIVDAAAASRDLLATVHEPALIEAVSSVVDPSRIDRERLLRFGLGTPDNPLFAGMHDAAAQIVGATVEACRQVWSGESLHSCNIAGGLHHAMRNTASGFCIYNDLAVGIQWLLDQGATRVAYVDVDVHHGDGVERIFADDPRVLTVSLHESGTTLFPGTGFAADIGGPQAPGSAVNVALPAGTSDAGWLRAFHAVAVPVLRAWQPEILVTQQGCDGHMDDPLSHLMLSVDGQRATYLALHELAHELCGGRWVATGGGGYHLTDVVPRAWTHLLAVVAGRPLEPVTAVPQEWRDQVREATGELAPSRLTDGRRPAWRPWEEGFNPHAPLDASIVESRAAHGLDQVVRAEI